MHSNPGKFLQECASALLASRRNLVPLQSLPRPSIDLAQGYAIQRKVADGESTSAAVGFKVANTNASSQKYLQVSHPFYGPILPSRCSWVASDEEKALSCKNYNLRLVEPEIGLVLQHDLPPLRDGARYSVTQVERAVGSVVSSVEIVHTSFRDWQNVGAGYLVADLASNGCFVLGEKAQSVNAFRKPGNLSDVLAHVRCKLSVNGKVLSTGIGSKALGGPINVLHFLANDINERSPGEHLKKGQVISTGVIVDPPYYFASPGDKVLIEYQSEDLHLPPIRISFQ